MLSVILSVSLFLNHLPFSWLPVCRLDPYFLACLGVWLMGDTGREGGVERGHGIFPWLCTCLIAPPAVAALLMRTGLCSKCGFASHSNILPLNHCTWSGCVHIYFHGISHNIIFDLGTLLWQNKCDSTVTPKITCLNMGPHHADATSVWGFGEMFFVKLNGWWILVKIFFLHLLIKSYYFSSLAYWCSGLH